MKYAALLCILLGLVAFAALSATASPSLDFDGADYHNDSSDFEGMLESISADQLDAPTLATMKLNAILSAASYCVKYDMQTLANWQCKTCKSSGITMSGTTAWEFASSQLGAYVGYDSTNKVIRVVFRGSSNWSNWQSNLNTARKPWTTPNGATAHVHAGFRDAWLTARDKVVAKVVSLRSSYSSAPIHISGHSLGGAVAKIAFLDLQKSVFSITSVSTKQQLLSGDYNDELTFVSSSLFPSDTQLSAAQYSALGMTTVDVGAIGNCASVMTFGQPRVFDQIGTRYFQSLAGSKYTRVTHDKDIVVRIPLLAMGFYHGANEVYFPDDTNTFKACSTTDGETKTCSLGNLLSLSIKDHSFYAGVVISQDATTCGK